MSLHPVGVAASLLALAALLVPARSLRGQPQARSQFSVTVGRASGSGGFFSERDLNTVDAGLTRALVSLASSRVAIRAGVYGGATFRFINSLDCPAHPTRRCAAEFPPMTSITPVVGAELGDSSAGVALYVGPSLASGRVGRESFSRVGVESRVEAGARVSSRVGIVVGTRWAVLPDVDATRVTLRTLHFGLRFY